MYDIGEMRNHVSMKLMAFIAYIAGGSYAIQVQDDSKQVYKLNEVFHDDLFIFDIRTDHTNFDIKVVNSRSEVVIEVSLYDDLVCPEDRLKVWINSDSPITDWRPLADPVLS